jgi:hypothetical protein
MAFLIVAARLIGSSSRWSRPRAVVEVECSHGAGEGLALRERVALAVRGRVVGGGDDAGAVDVRLVVDVLHLVHEDGESVVVARLTGAHLSVLVPGRLVDRLGLIPSEALQRLGLGSAQVAVCPGIRVADLLEPVVGRELHVERAVAEAGATARHDGVGGGLDVGRDGHGLAGHRVPLRGSQWQR